jgi:hypothetical protein
MGQLIQERYEATLTKLYKALKTKYTDDMVGVHFTRINKVGIRTDPAHHDPIGVYAFPRNYVLNDIKNEGFAGMEFSHIIVPSSKAKILNLGTISEKTASRLLTQMGIPSSYLTDETTYHNSGADVGHMLWGAMERWRHENKLSKNSSWNTLFKKTGYNVLYDPGLKIIHWAEPTQIVYMTPGTYKVVDTFSKNNNSELFKQFVEAFPDWVPKKTKSYSEVSLQLKKGNSAILVTPSQYFNFGVNIYGRVEKTNTDPQRLSYREFYEAGDAIEDAIEDAKKFIKNSLDDTSRSEQEYISRFQVEEFCKYFKFKTPQSGTTIVRKYDETDGSGVIKLIISFHSNAVTFQVERRISYSMGNFYFYSPSIPYNGPKEVTETAFKAMESQLKEYEAKGESDYEHYYKALRGGKVLKYIKRNVFKL